MLEMCMIANFLRLKAKKRRAKFQAERMIAYARLLKLRMSLRSRHFLHADALLQCVVHAPWYVMYRNGSDSDLISAISYSMTEARVEWPSLNDQIRMVLAVEAKDRKSVV